MSESDWEAGEGSAGSSTGAPGGLSDGEFAAAGIPAYAVKLPVFEGPLDLLLHLIRQNDVEIAEIPVAENPDIMSCRINVAKPSAGPPSQGPGK